ncbi:uncharacterized protein LOC132301284 [Cornus florida]|uniref:uncharacterized protein LOC132301284 n=1 Tax=Cornus florida TaxID=4283 RepID=UPI00289FA491|nr:uncharacterized protein LOC132301284 [Cornus florida]
MECYAAALKTKQLGETLAIETPEGLIEKEPTQRVEPIEDLMEIDLDEEGIGKKHRLNEDPSFKPIRQKRRVFTPERNRAISQEVEKLLKADFIREVQCPHWLSNVVLVKKTNGKWRLCVDFTNLNKACPNDSFLLLRIDMLVEGTTGHELLSFIDAYSGYNQIPMYAPDSEKTSFITDKGLYCYKVMPFGLKNAGVTYQRLVNTMFKQQVGRNIKVYMDDMLVKSLKAKDHFVDLHESFDVLRAYKMQLNPNKKCLWGILGKIYGVYEERYPAIEKLAFALVVAARKLRPYFQAQTMIVLTDQPLRQILYKPETSGRLMKWSVEFELSFPQKEDEVITSEMNHETQLGDTWSLYVDGSSTARACGAGLVLISPEGENLKYALRFGFKATNNEAEYEALIAGLKLAKAFRVQHLKVFTDSQLVTGIENENTDALARLATTVELKNTKAIPLEYLEKPSILEEYEEINQLEPGLEWANSIIKYIMYGELPQDLVEAQKVRIRAPRYTFMNGVLYKRGFFLPFLRYVSTEEAHYTMKEIHEGVCGNYAGGRSLANKAIRQGYYWLTMQKDAL